jgi:aspartyl/asparaginyl beta-hydroxylase (cupin superfamily)
MVDSPVNLLADADQAVQAGDLHRAANLLREAAREGSNDPTLWMKLAGLERACGDPAAALEAIHSGLALAPLDFTLLLMRASILQRMDHPDAGEAWSHALAQKPEGKLLPQIEAAVDEAETRAAEWTRSRERKMQAAMAASEANANEDELQRIRRFRNNALRVTRPYHSEPTDFHFPGLAEREFHPRRLFPWLQELEECTEKIEAELQAVLAAERAELVPYIQYAEHLPMAQWKPLNHNPDWTAIHLLQNGDTIEANVRHCPATMELLRKMPQPVIPGASPNAMFSLLKPRTRIPPHVGVNNARLVCHLPLIVPEGCWFRVGAEKRFWKLGEAFVFDDTIEHEALNPTDELRVVLIFDVWHPDLSEIERDAIAALISTESSNAGL